MFNFFLSLCTAASLVAMNGSIRNSKGTFAQANTRESTPADTNTPCTCTLVRRDQCWSFVISFAGFLVLRHGCLLSPYLFLFHPPCLSFTRIVRRNKRVHRGANAENHERGIRSIRSALKIGYLFHQSILKMIVPWKQ